MAKQQKPIYQQVLSSLTAGTNALYQPIRGEADISPDHVRHESTSTFDAQNDARGKNCGEISEK